MCLFVIQVVSDLFISKRAMCLFVIQVVSDLFISMQAMCLFIIQVVSDLFISKRAMYVLTIDDKENQKDGCKRIFSLMCHILNKVRFWL